MPSSASARRGRTPPAPTRPSRSSGIRVPPRPPAPPRARRSRLRPSAQPSSIRPAKTSTAPSVAAVLRARRVVAGPLAAARPRSPYRSPGRAADPACRRRRSRNPAGPSPARASSAARLACAAAAVQRAADRRRAGAGRRRDAARTRPRRGGRPPREQVEACWYASTAASFRRWPRPRRRPRPAARPVATAFAQAGCRSARRNSSSASLCADTSAASRAAINACSYAGSGHPPARKCARDERMPVATLGRGRVGDPFVQPAPGGQVGVGVKRVADQRMPEVEGRRVGAGQDEVGVLQFAQRRGHVSSAAPVTVVSRSKSNERPMTAAARRSARVRGGERAEPGQHGRRTSVSGTAVACSAAPY